MQEYWSPRKLLICKYLLLNKQAVSGILTAEQLFFNLHYPNPTFLWQEQLRILKCLIGLEEEGYIKLMNIKIGPEYLSIYADTEQFPGLAEAAQHAGFGLSPRVLARVRKGITLNTEVFADVLKSDAVRLDGSGDGDINIKRNDLQGDEFISALSAVEPGHLEAFMHSLLEVPPGEEDFKKYYINYHLTFPVVIAKYASFAIQTNEERLSGAFNQYISEFADGKLQGGTKRYFSYAVQKRVALTALAKMADKQGLSKLNWWLGYWDKDQGVSEDSTEEDDELLHALKLDYPDYYQAWRAKDLTYGRQYEFKFYETLFALEQEAILSITNISSEFRGTLKYAADLLLGDWLQVLSVITMDILKPAVLGTAKTKATVQASEATLTSAQLKESALKTFPYKLPAGTKWENFIVKFLDDDKVYIVVQGKEHTADYKEMGFIDGRNGRPDQQWAFLRLLARRAGELSWENPEAGYKLKKTKELVAKALQQYFHLDYDPFYPYTVLPPFKTQKSYKIKMTLVSPTQDAPDDANNDPLDIAEFFEEQSPKIYDGDT